jgi:hypothetical protein
MSQMNSALALALVQTGIAKPEALKQEAEAEVTCQYCGKPARLVTGETIYPRLDYLHEKLFWHCAPCAAWVGCHGSGNGYGDGTRPLGVLANASLRAAKKAVHDVFDPLWQDGFMRRKEAYKWLAAGLGIPPDQCHVGSFSLEQCNRAKVLCEAYTA